MLIIIYIIVIFLTLFFVAQSFLAKHVSNNICEKNHNYPQLEDVLSRTKTHSGKTLDSLDPYIIVFLRHFGCTFCKEMLSDISEYLAQDSHKLTLNVVFVHMIDNEDARKELSKYTLDSAEVISDSTLDIYRAFGLSKGRFYQLFSLKVWIKALYLTLFKRHSLIGKAQGDVFQMPGVFYIRNGKVVASFQPEFASEAFTLSAFSKDIEGIG